MAKTKEQRRLELERELEWRQCEESFPYFFATYWIINVPEVGRVQVQARPLQLESAQLFQDEKRVIILKARQIGWTTLVQAYLFWKTFFFANMETMALSKKEDPDAMLIITGIKNGYDSLPSWMRKRGPDKINDNMSSIRWSNKSYVESDASKEDPARGRTLAVLVLDEFGKFPNPDNAWGSATPATEFGQLIVLGNANGYGTRFWRLCDQAKRGLSDFVYRFYPWHAAQDRTQEWFDSFTSSMLPSEVAAEYPSNDVECWVQAGNPVYDIDRLDKIEVDDSGHVELEPEYQATMTTWLEVDPKKQYVFGVDVSMGKGDGDYSVIQCIEVESGRHAFEWRARYCSPPEFADKLNEMGRYWNDALLGVEVNGVGEAVVNRLREHHHYPNIYIRKVWNRASSSQVIKYGWDTNEDTKPAIISELSYRLFEGAVQTKHKDLIGEMKGYRYLKNGTMGGMPHDDRVMSMAIATRIWSEQAKVSLTPQHAKIPQPDDGTMGGMLVKELGEDFYRSYYGDDQSDRFTMNGDSHGYAFSED